MHTALEQRLRSALAHTHDRAPRPVTSIEMPFGLSNLITPRLLARLRPASVLVPLIRRQAGLSVVLTVRSEHLRSHRGQISFPGGRREEADSSAAEAALREAQEEVGLDPRQIEVIGYLDDYPTITKYVVTPVVGIVSGEPQFQLDAGEVAEVFEVPLDFLLDAKNYQRKLISNGGINVPFFEINFGSYRIWGATAGMLRNLVQKIESA
jgi:8-oxo-dGTP pyrophosphatase MutT (NUDIX family)